jgi:lipid-binding SYLF domain-containing protein
MKKVLLFLIFTFIFGVSSAGLSADLEDYSNTIEVFRSFPVLERFFYDSYGYAVFPTVGKAGFILGGSYGKGQVYRKGIVTGKTSLIEGSLGFQFGGKAFSEIIFFKDKWAYERFTRGNFEFDASVQAIVLTAGAEVKGSSTGISAGASAGPRTGVQAEAEYHYGMATFVHSIGGLMVEVSLGGQKFTFEPLL